MMWCLLHQSWNNQTHMLIWHTFTTKYSLAHLCHHTKAMVFTCLYYLDISSKRPTQLVVFIISLWITLFFLTIVAFSLSSNYSLLPYLSIIQLFFIALFVYHPTILYCLICLCIHSRNLSCLSLKFSSLLCVHHIF